MTNGKTGVEALREQIKVTNAEPPDEENTGAVKEESSGEDEGDSEENDDTGEVESKDESGSGDDTGDDPVEKTEEELEAEKKAAKTQREKDRIQRRIDKEVALRKAVENERDELRAQLEKKIADGDRTLTEEDVKTEAKRLADETIANKEFIDSCNRVADEATKLDKDFIKKVNLMAEDIGPIPVHMIGILDDLDNKGAVMLHLVEEIDEAERIYGLSPARMALALAKISTKLAETAKKPPKQISKVADPITPITSGKGGVRTLNDTMTDAEWIELRNKETQGGFRKRA